MYKLFEVLKLQICVTSFASMSYLRPAYAEKDWDKCKFDNSNIINNDMLTGDTIIVNHGFDIEVEHSRNLYNCMYHLQSWEHVMLFQRKLSMQINSLLEYMSDTATVFEFFKYLKIKFNIWLYKLDRYFQIIKIIQKI